MRGAGAGADEMYSEGHLRLQNVCIAMSSGERRGKRERERERDREREGEPACQNAGTPPSKMVTLNCCYKH